MVARCPNPYCDGRGWIRCDATGTANAYATPACKVGPHPSSRQRRRGDDGAKERCEACGALTPVERLHARSIGLHLPIRIVVCDPCNELDYDQLRERWDGWETVNAQAGAPSLGGER